MRTLHLDLPGLPLLQPSRIGDSWGYFSETHREEALTEAGVNIRYVQENQVRTAQSGVFRGLHFQEPPHAQDKLIGAISGSILDIAVDIRCSSPTYGCHVAVELNAENGWQLLLPTGFAHGYLPLTPDCLVTYKVSQYYTLASEGGLNWADRNLSIDWRLAPEDITTNERDRTWPDLHTLKSPFQ